MKSFLALTLFLILPTMVFSQDTSMIRVENDLKNSYRPIINHRDYGQITDTIVYDTLHPATSTIYIHKGLPLDTLELYNRLFDQKMGYYTAHFPPTLTWPFDSLKEEVGIVSSEDSLFRIYSWDRCDGGTMHYFDNIFQYRSGDRVYSNLFVDTAEAGEVTGAGIFYSHIYILNANNKTYYLVIGGMTLSSSDDYQFIKIYAIEGTSLNESVNLIKDKKGLHNSIGVEYIFNLPVNSARTLNPSIKYSTLSQTIYIPVVTKNSIIKKGQITYKFNGNYFVNTGVLNIAKIDSGNTHTIQTDNKQWLVKAHINPKDSLISLSSLSFGHEQTADWRIFGYQKPDIHATKMILISVFTNDVEGNPFNCPFGAWYGTNRMRNKGIQLKYLTTKGPFIKAGIMRTGDRLPTGLNYNFVHFGGKQLAVVYMPKRWFTYK